jgi:Coenzyme PQQ synthesis protein D (PqqD)
VLLHREPVLSRLAPGFAVICTIDGRCVEMAGSAVDIWEAIPRDGSPVAVTELVAALVATHRLDRQVVEDAVAAVVAELVEAGCAVQLP